MSAKHGKVEHLQIKLCEAGLTKNKTRYNSDIRGKIPNIKIFFSSTEKKIRTTVYLNGNGILFDLLIKSMDDFKRTKRLS